MSNWRVKLDEKLFIRNDCYTCHVYYSKDLSFQSLKSGIEGNWRVQLYE